MIIDKITSRQNPLVKRFRAVRQGQERHLLLIEGVRLMEEAINARLHFEAIVFSERLTNSERGKSLYEKLLQMPGRGAQVTETLLESISDVETPQGILAIAHLPHADLTDAIRNNIPLIVIAHQLQDPGNLGTIVRTAEAAGADSLIVTPGTVNPFNFKALRASMGSAFRLPIITNIRWQQLAEFAREKKFSLIAADVRGNKNYTDFDWQQPTALILGQEGGGIDELVMAFVQERITIPMSPPVDSLNVAAAASLLLYEAARQRKFQFS